MQPGSDDASHDEILLNVVALNVLDLIPDHLDIDEGWGEWNRWLELAERVSPL